MSTEYEAILMYGIPMDSFEDSVDYLLEKGIIVQKEAELSKLNDEILIDEIHPA